MLELGLRLEADVREHRTAVALHEYLIGAVDHDLDHLGILQERLQRSKAEDDVEQGLDQRVVVRPGHHQTGVAAVGWDGTEAAAGSGGTEAAAPAVGSSGTRAPRAEAWSARFRH